MRFYILSLFLLQTLMAYEIPADECLHASYGHTLGGTMHSKTFLKKALLKKHVSTLAHTKDETLLLLQKSNPTLHVEDGTFILKHCRLYFKAHSKEKSSLFDPITLHLIKEI